MQGTGKTLVRRLQTGLALASIAIAAAWPALAGDAYRLGAQDKVRVRAFEWRPSRDETFEWVALSDEFRIGASGTLMLPLVGEIAADGMKPEELALAIGERMKRNLRLVASPDVTVEIVQFRPFYIVGQVERPGEFQFRPGLTVLQAVALAGGLQRARDVGLMRIERDVIGSRGEIKSLDLERIGLLARRARLQGEIADLPTLDFPVELKRMADDPVTQTILRQETTIFTARLNAFKTQNDALAQLREYLNKEVVSLGAQAAAEDKQAALIQRELSNVTTLVEKGLSAIPRQFSLERTKAQLEGDRLRLGTGLLKAQQEISRVAITILELRNKRIGDAAIELRLTQVRLDEIAARRATAEQLLDEAETAGPNIALRRRRQPPPRYTLTRVGQRYGETVIDEATALQPGDTLKVEVLQADLDSGLDRPFVPTQAFGAN